MRMIDLDLLLIALDKNIAEMRVRHKDNAIAEAAINLVQTQRDFIAAQPIVCVAEQEGK